MNKLTAAVLAVAAASAFSISPAFADDKAVDTTQMSCMGKDGQPMVAKDAEDCTKNGGTWTAPKTQ